MTVEELLTELKKCPDVKRPAWNETLPKPTRTRPNKIKIVGKTVTIKWNSAGVRPDMGDWRWDEQEIRIAPDLQKGLECETVLHEVIEAIKCHLRLKLPHDTLQTLSTILWQVLTENPKLTDYIFRNK